MIRIIIGSVLFAVAMGLVYCNIFVEDLRDIVVAYNFMSAFAFGIGGVILIATMDD